MENGDPPHARCSLRLLSMTSSSCTWLLGRPRRLALAVVATARGHPGDGFNSTEVVQRLKSTSGYITESDEWRVVYQDYEFCADETVDGVDPWDEALDAVQAALRDLELTASVLKQSAEASDEHVPRLRHVAQLVTTQMKMLRKARDKASAEYKKLAAEADVDNNSMDGPALEELQESLDSAAGTIELMSTLNKMSADVGALFGICLLYTSPSPRDRG